MLVYGANISGASRRWRRQSVAAPPPAPVITPPALTLPRLSPALLFPSPRHSLAPSLSLFLFRPPPSFSLSLLFSLSTILTFLPVSSLYILFILSPPLPTPRALLLRFYLFFSLIYLRPPSSLAPILHSIRLHRASTALLFDSFILSLESPFPFSLTLYIIRISLTSLLSAPSSPCPRFSRVLSSFFRIKFSVWGGGD